MQEIHPNQQDPRLLSLAALNPFNQHNSAARTQMFGSHLSQALVVEGATTRRILSGLEREMGEATFDIRIPEDIVVLDILEKYPHSYGRSIEENPLSLLIYEELDTNRIGVLEVPSHHSMHQHFGFRYKKEPIVNSIRPTTHLRKGTRLARSPAVDEHGYARMGIETEVAFMSVPGVIEDGVIISQEYAEMMATTMISSRVGNWGQNYYPLNLYGDENEYKPFPDIGQTIRADGLLFALRRFDDALGVIEMTPAALREPDHTFDTLVYGEAGARVTDVSVIWDQRGDKPFTPEGMEKQVMAYYESARRYYRRIIDFYEMHNKRRRGWENGMDWMTEEFHRLVVEAKIYCNEPVKMGAKDQAKRIPGRRMYQHQTLDEWRVEVTFEHRVIPSRAFKLTGTHGDKGVVCDVWPTEDMPVDAQGNRAHCIMDADSTIKRMNIGRLYEQYINATSREVSNRVRAMMKQTSPANYAKAWKYLLRYYEIVSPKMAAGMQSETYKGTPEGHVDAVVKSGVFVWIPTDNPAYSPDIVRQLQKEYPIPIGPVTYRGRSGNVVTTASPVLIGSIYVMLLEKTGTDWSACSSAKRQHLGLPACMTKQDKYSLPGRANPMRLTGESEVRLMAAVSGGPKTAELLDLSNNPIAHQELVSNIMSAENPFAIPSIVDRKKIPVGGSRPLMFVNHILQCGGIELFYKPDSQFAPTIYPPDPTDLEEAEEVSINLDADAPPDEDESDNENAIEETPKRKVAEVEDEDEEEEAVGAEEVED